MFVRWCRDSIAEEMAVRRLRRGGGGPAPLASLALDGVDLGGLADELGPTSLEELTLGEGW